MTLSSVVSFESSGMTTMGADTFIEFLLSYFVDLMISFLERLYIAPIVNQMIGLYPRWKMMVERRWRGGKRLTRWAMRCGVCDVYVCIVHSFVLEPLSPADC